MDINSCLEMGHSLARIEKMGAFQVDYSHKAYTYWDKVFLDNMDRDMDSLACPFDMDWALNFENHYYLVLFDSVCNIHYKGYED